MKLKRTLSFALTALLAVSTSSQMLSQVNAQTTNTSISLQAEETVTFENSQLKVALKVSSKDNERIDKLEIKRLNLKKEIEEQLKEIPDYLKNEDFELIVIHVLDKDGNQLLDVVSEMSVTINDIRGRVVDVYNLEEQEADKVKLAFRMNKDQLEFVTPNTHEIAITYQETEDSTAKVETTVASTENRIASIIELTRTEEEKIDKVIEIGGNETDRPSTTEPINTDNRPTAPEITTEEPSQPTLPEEPSVPVLPEQPTIPVNPEPEKPTEETTVEETTEATTEETTFDLMADDDGDGFTNGTEISAGTDYKDKDSFPPKDGNKDKHLKYFKTFKDADDYGYAQLGKNGLLSYLVFEQINPNGENWFEITFEYKEEKPEEEQPEETTVEETTEETTEATTEETTEETSETPKEDNAEEGKAENVTGETEETKEATEETPNNETVDSPSVEDNATPTEETPSEAPDSVVLPSGMSETLREQHEGFLANGYVYNGIDAEGSHTYTKHFETDAPSGN